MFTCTPVLHALNIHTFSPFSPVLMLPLIKFSEKVTF